MLEEGDAELASAYSLDRVEEAEHSLVGAGCNSLEGAGCNAFGEDAAASVA